jgi:hypothetical protein
MTTLTQKERIAATEATQKGHQREHELVDRAWSAKLDGIDARIRGVERILLELRLPGTEYPGAPLKKALSKRDMSIMGGSAALTSLLWWLLEFVSEFAAS